MNMKLLLFTAFLATIFQVEARDPKFIFVYSTTSTSVSTTTSMISATITCLQLSSTTYSACTGRKKRAKLIDDEGLNSDLSFIGSKIARNAVVPELEDSNNKAAQSGREARFAWYYMTTTLTSVSTSTTTVSTLSVSVIACTPTTFLGCGK